MVKDSGDVGTGLGLSKPQVGSSTLRPPRVLEPCLAVVALPAHRPLASLSAFLGLLKHVGRGPFLQ